MIESQFGHPVEMETPLYDGVQYIFKFANGLGASVVRRAWSYGARNGLWELCPITWDGDYDWSLYTQKTHDVFGNLFDDEVREMLNQIEEGEL